MKIPVFGKIILTGTLLAALAGCGIPPSGGADRAQSNADRITAPQAPAEDLQALTAGNTAFAVDLYHELAREEGNLFFSPHSISTALAMTYAGARGTTAEEMAGTLHFTLPAERLHPAFNALDLALQPGEPAPEMEPLELHQVNSLWGQRGYPFRPEFLDLLAQNYGAGMQLVDYEQAPEPARQAINQWVSEQTKSRIKDLIAPGLIDSSTRLVLVNAIYFKGGWLYPFDAQATADAPFSRLDGSTVEVPQMTWIEGKSVRYGRGPGYQTVELPYQGGNAALTLLVPDAGQFAAFEEGLTAERLAALLDEMREQQVALSLPRFHNERAFDLTVVLQRLGITTAMSGDADFSGMTGTRDLFINAVVHKAFVDVNESGTEAAAATAVIMNKEMVLESPIELKVDRPFIYLIRDTQTGAVLFMGRVVDPQS